MLNVVKDGYIQFGVRVQYVDELHKPTEVILAKNAKHAFELSIALRHENVKQIDVVYIKLDFTTIDHHPKMGWHDCVDCDWQGQDYYIHLQDTAYAMERAK